MEKIDNGEINDVWDIEFVAMISYIIFNAKYFPICRFHTVNNILAFDSFQFCKVSVDRA